MRGPGGFPRCVSFPERSGGVSRGLGLSLSSLSPVGSFPPNLPLCNTSRDGDFAWSRMFRSLCSNPGTPRADFPMIGPVLVLLSQECHKTGTLRGLGGFSRCVPFLGRRGGVSRGRRLSLSSFSPTTLGVGSYSPLFFRFEFLYASILCELARRWP